nr:hypothetical protein [Tanacetum cinerariifolium]
KTFWAFINDKLLGGQADTIARNPTPLVVAAIIALVLLAVGGYALFRNLEKLRQIALFNKAAVFVKGLTHLRRLRNGGPGGGRHWAFPRAGAGYLAGLWHQQRGRHCLRSSGARRPNAAGGADGRHQLHRRGSLRQRQRSR